MKKTIIALSIVGITILALGVAGFAYAQSPEPPSPETQFGKGSWGRSNTGMMGLWANGDMQTALETALADTLNLTVEEIQTRFEAGATHLEIAIAEGMTEEEFFDLMSSLHSSFLDEAVASGSITQEQADWMKARMGQKWGAGASRFGGFGRGRCGGSMFGDDFQPRWGGMSY